MAAKRPPIIRATNKDLIVDVCALTSLLEQQHLNETMGGAIYVSNPKRCHQEGVDAYNTYHDHFEEALSEALFQAYNDWVRRARRQTTMGNFKKDFDWTFVTNDVKDNHRKDLSPVVKMHLTQIITAMTSELASICSSDGSRMSIFL